MAFNPERLSLVVEPIGGVGLRWFNYQTDESEDDLIATDYLPDAEKYGLRLYDLIFVSPTSGTEEPYFLTVDAIDADGNATLVNSARFGSDTLSYRDKAAVGRIRVPASADNILVSAYDATANPSAGRANYRAASDADYAATPALLRVTDAAGRKFVVNEKRLSPDLAGGDPDGVTDATAAFNAIFEHIRTDIAANPDAFTRYVVDLAGGKYRVTGSINATAIQAWNLVIANGAIIGACTGKPVLDLTGSRGYTLANLHVYGEEDNQPSIGILAARATTGTGACDNNYHFNVSVTGYFSVAADFAYGQETTKREHCRYWNSNIDAYCGVYQCNNAVTATSDFMTIRTGEQSFLQVSFDTCDWRQLPTGNRYVITAISKGATTTVTCGGGHTFTNGQTVTFWAVAGMVEINARAGTISNVTATTFDINIDSTTFTNFTSGYAVRQASKPTIYWDGGRQHNFKNCYAVGYGQDLIEIGFVSTPARATLFEILAEGAQSRSTFRLLPGTTARTMYDVEFKSDATASRSSFFSTNASGSGKVSFYGSGVRVMANANISPTGYLLLFDDATKYGLYAKCNVLWPHRTAVAVTSLIKSYANITALDDGKTVYGGKYNGTWTPTVTAGSGTITTYTASGTFVQISDDLAYIEVAITVTTNGTGATNIQFTLPTGVTGASSGFRFFSGREAAAGKMVVGQIANTSGTVIVFNYDNTYPAFDGAIIRISGELKAVL